MKRLLVLALFLAVTPALFAQQAVPEIPFDSVANFFKLPADLHFGEASGVAVNSKGHIFVFNRGTTTGPAYGATAAQILEFGPDGKYIREIGNTRCASIGRTTSGPSTKARIWLSSSIQKAA